MMSPTPAVRRFEPPSTLMHWTRFAPLLSATSRLDCIWIIVRPLSSQIFAHVSSSATSSPLSFPSPLYLFDVFGLGFALALRCLGRLLGRFLGLGLRLRRRDHLRIGDVHSPDLRGADTIDHLPGLQLRDRRAFHDAHDLADVEFVRRVVSMVLLRQLDDLAVERVLHPPLDTDHDRLVTLFGHHGAGEDALWHLVSLLSPSPARGRVQSAAS